MRKHVAFIALLVLGMIVASLLSGCATADRCARKYPPSVVERVKEVRRDSIITLPGETVWLDVPPCTTYIRHAELDSASPRLSAKSHSTSACLGLASSLSAGLGGGRTLLATQRQGRAVVSLYRLPDGRTVAECKCDSTKHIVKDARVTISTDKKERQVIQTPVRGIVWWSGIALYILAGLYITYKILRWRALL